MATGERERSQEHSEAPTPEMVAGDVEGKVSDEKRSTVAPANPWLSLSGG